MPAISGRPDGRLSKYIYADGFGGVCRDMRYSANGLTPTDFAEADQRVKNGTYRGFEKPLFTRFYPNAFSGYFAAENEYNAVIKTGASGTGVNVPMYSSGLAFKDPIIMWNSVTNQVLYGVVSDADGYVRVKSLSNNLGQTSHQLNLFRNSTDLWYFAKVTEQPSSVGGSFLQTDVIGNPANILATPQLANGWQGSWIPTLPNSVNSTWSLTRKCLNTPIYSVRDEAGSGVWTQSSSYQIALDSNALLGYPYPATSVVVLQYQAFAKQTKPGANTMVYGGQSGVGCVATVRVHDVKEGSLLQECLIGKVNKDNAAWLTSANLTTIGLSAKGSFVAVNGYESVHPKHMFDSTAPTNNSPAVKALNYNVASNQQGFINYAYTELKHNGTNWGDDGKVTIADNQSTKTDLNGNTVLVGTAQTCESLGWIKNKL